jgi:hypothetical protein
MTAAYEGCLSHYSGFFEMIEAAYVILAVVLIVGAAVCIAIAAVSCRHLKKRLDRLEQEKKDEKQ